jgi:hypothetical protein
MRPPLNFVTPGGNNMNSAALVASGIKKYSSSKTRIKHTLARMIGTTRNASTNVKIYKAKKDTLPIV